MNAEDSHCPFMQGIFFLLLFCKSVLRYMGVGPNFWTFHDEELERNSNLWYLTVVM